MLFFQNKNYDNSPLSGLISIGELDLLQKIYGKVIIPKAVFEEILLLQNNGLDISSFLNAEWISIEYVNFELFIHINFPPKIHAGEKEAMLLFLQLNADWLVIDEHEGRKIATSLGINIVGLLGILIKAKQENYITSLKDFLERLEKKSNFRLSEKLKIQALTIVDEI